MSLFRLLHEDSRGPQYRGCPFINAAAEFPEPGPVATEIARHRGRLRELFARAGGPLVVAPGRLDAIVALYGGAMSAAHLDRDPDVVLHAAEAARRLLDTGAAQAHPRRP